jgi:hypothetical protein
MTLSRSVQTAVLSMSGEIGGLLGTVAFRGQDAPRYVPGMLTPDTRFSKLLLRCIPRSRHVIDFTGRFAFGAICDDNALLPTE